MQAPTAPWLDLSAGPGAGSGTGTAVATADAADLPRLSRRSRFGELLDIYDLFLAPVASLGERARLASDPALLQRKSELETAWLAELDSAPVPDDLPEDPVAAMRLLATRNRLPQVYRWLASSASYEQIVRFLALEGGPDAGFDDLVALAQVGLSGLPKLEMATNYWDEMGNGSLIDVHTELHTRMATALDMPRLPRAEIPESGLERMALGGLLATNRWLQPELVGMLGLIELQAGPRCRLVDRALERVGAPEEARPFYGVHADVDPRHGADWLDKVIAPLAEDVPAWRERMVRGAWWRWSVNDAFFSGLRV